MMTVTVHCHADATSCVREGHTLSRIQRIIERRDYFDREHAKNRVRQALANKVGCIQVLLATLAKPLPTTVKSFEQSFFPSSVEAVSPRLGAQQSALVERPTSKYTHAESTGNSVRWRRHTTSVLI